ncbi:MAG: formylglycine-generating enzyme family protein [Myxococcales bacterium]|nr:formylglycine-generating enzyme family protein [Myxococcales bacterium]
MGSPDGRAGHCHAGRPAEPGRGDHEPPRTATVPDALWVMETEVTQGQWFAVMQTRPAYFAACGDDCPVERVSWYEAIAFANALSQAEGLTPAYRVGPARGTPGRGLAPGTPWATGTFRYATVGRVAGASGYRLPTEPEWEWLARAGTTGAIYAGFFEIRGENDAPALDPIAWYAGNSGLPRGYDSSGWSAMQRPARRSGTHPVGQKAANPWGLRDVLGSVYEWCWPEPAGSRRRPIRGGSWSSVAREVRAAHRVLVVPARRDANLGVRLVRAPAGP